jgi:hypothetical protein
MNKTQFVVGRLERSSDSFGESFGLTNNKFLPSFFSGRVALLGRNNFLVWSRGGLDVFMSRYAGEATDAFAFYRRYYN